jgi:hypothetical protein
MATSFRPFKLDDDGFHEVWLGKAHESDDHARHESGSTDKWQVDIMAKVKGAKPFYKAGIGIDSLVGRDKDDDKPAFQPFDYKEWKARMDEMERDRKERARERDRDSDWRLPALSSSPSSISFAPLSLNLPSLSDFRASEQERRKERRGEELLEERERGSSLVDKMTRDSLRALEQMAADRHEDYKEMCRTAPSGYEHVSLRPQSGWEWYNAAHSPPKGGWPVIKTGREIPPPWERPPSPLRPW